MSRDTCRRRRRLRLRTISPSCGFVHAFSLLTARVHYGAILLFFSKKKKKIRNFFGSERLCFICFSSITQCIGYYSSAFYGAMDQARGTEGAAERPHMTHKSSFDVILLLLLCTDIYTYPLERYMYSNLSPKALHNNTRCCTTYTITSKRTRHINTLIKKKSRHYRVVCIKESFDENISNNISDNITFYAER